MRSLDSRIKRIEKKLGKGRPFTLVDFVKAAITGKGRLPPSGESAWLDELLYNANSPAEVTKGNGNST